MIVAGNWLAWALLSAVFAALTAILAKIGLEGIDSDFATLVRCVVILVALAAFVWAAGKWTDPTALANSRLRTAYRTPANRLDAADGRPILRSLRGHSARALV